MQLVIIFLLLRQRLTTWWWRSENWQSSCLSLWCASVTDICHQAWLYKIFIINFPMLPYSTFCCWVHYDVLAHTCSVPVVQDDFLSWFLLFWFTSLPTHKVSWEQLWNELVTMEFLFYGLFLGEANPEMSSNCFVHFFSVCAFQARS